MYVGNEKSRDRPSGYGMGLDSATLQAKGEINLQKKGLDFQSHTVMK